MARGRMLDQGFMRSNKLRKCSRDARLIYASILPFLDREGRTIAEPIVLKATVFRRSDFTLEEVAAGIQELHQAKLIHLYADEDNDAILEFVNFLDFNTPNHKEAQSKFPKPGSKDAAKVRDPLLIDTPEGSPGGASQETAKTAETAPGIARASENQDASNAVQHNINPELPGGRPGQCPGTNPVSSNATLTERNENANGRGPSTGAPTTPPLQKTERPQSADRPEGPTAQAEEPPPLTGIPEVDRYIHETRARVGPDPYAEQLDRINAKRLTRKTVEA